MDKEELLNLRIIDGDDAADFDEDDDFAPEGGDDLDGGYDDDFDDVEDDFDGGYDDDFADLDDDDMDDDF